MKEVLLLDHRGMTVDSLQGVLSSIGAAVVRKEPESIVGPLPSEGYDGIVASGGYLRAESRGQTLSRYSALFNDLGVPFLGVCLGMKIMGYCYGARIAKIAPVVGERRVTLRRFPLCPDLRQFSVHQNHRYELVEPLPDALENFSGEGEIQAVKVRGRDQYAVQFHPEVGSSPARVVFENFLSMC